MRAARPSTILPPLRFRPFVWPALGGLALACGLSAACSSSDEGSPFPDGTPQEGTGLDAGDPSTPDFGEGGVEVPDTGPSGPACGNGNVEGAETCDDGNVVPGDGCSATCALEAGYECKVAGTACSAAACGDGIVAGVEDCDDGNAKDGDGCSALCRLEEGYACNTAGQPCVLTVCGDGKKEGTEQCDDGNKQAYDGCSPTCELEPKCAGGKCSAVCGDGLKFPGEECDDGNVRDNDGCSKDCKLEDGFACNVVVSEPPGALDLPVVYRDFLPHNYAGTIPAGYTHHPDFEQYNPGLCRGLIESTLDADSKPVLKNGKACDASKTWMTSTDSFKQWYRDGLKTGNLLVNKRFDATLRLTKRGDGGYLFDSNEAPYSEGKFFPLDAVPAANAFGIEKDMKDSAGVERSFHFTSELKYWFTYKAGTDPKLEFRGDDDVWVFINNKLAVDIGGVHGKENGSVTLDQATAQDLGLVDGGMYEIVVFQAERHTSSSNYKLTLRGFERARTDCKSVCGDGVKTSTEACDDGKDKNVGGYGKCNADCTLGPRCGDGILQSDQGEQCDDGNRVNGDGCSSECKRSNGPA